LGALVLSTLQLILLAVAMLAVLAAYFLWRSGTADRGRAGLPRGRVIYADTDRWEESEPLYAPRYALAGKPDYLLRLGRQVIPVEVKPGRRADEPYDADILQLAAYCLLVEETWGHPPSYGLLHYREHTFRIPYTGRLRRTLLATMDDMRRDMARRDVSRSHREATRCRFCGHREDCGQSLVD
jgi:CRISPR-associated exonuclease Cas4